MKTLSLSLIILASFTFNLSKATQNNNVHAVNFARDSIYRIWKFKKNEMVQNFGGGMFAIDKYDTWDLTKKGALRYNIADSLGAFHDIPYKLIDNAIVLQFLDKKADFGVRYKIKELTPTSLKVIMHITDSENIKEFDVIELDFESTE